MENEKYWATYKFYDEKGRRMAIFASMTETNKEGEAGPLHIITITCSKKDQFSKKWAKVAFEALQRPLLKGEVRELPFHPNQYFVNIKDNKPKWTFIRWCEEMFYKREMITFEFDGYILCRKKDDDILSGIEPCSKIRVKGLEEEAKNAV